LLSLLLSLSYVRETTVCRRSISQILREERKKGWRFIGATGAIVLAGSHDKYYTCIYCAHCLYIQVPVDSTQPENRYKIIIHIGQRHAGSYRSHIGHMYIGRYYTKNVACYAHPEKRFESSSTILKQYIQHNTIYWFLKRKNIKRINK